MSSSTGITAIYLRTSGRPGDARGQEAELKRWAAAGQPTGGVRWYRDGPAGAAGERPGFRKLLEDVAAGGVARVVVWRIDRLGHTARGLAALLEDLLGRGVDLVSVREGLRLATPSGRLLAGLLAGVAAYESEARADRIKAGQAAARAAGKRWGGSPKGRRLKVTPDQEGLVIRLRRQNRPIAQIGRAAGLSRPTIYRILRTAPAAAGLRPKRRSRGADRRARASSGST